MGVTRSAIDTLDVSWSTLQNPDVADDSLDVVRDMGFTRTTPVQAGTIPRAMKHQDCVVEVSYPVHLLSTKLTSRLSRGQERHWLLSYPLWNGSSGGKRGSNGARSRRSSLLPLGQPVWPPDAQKLTYSELAQQIHDVFLHFISALHPLPTESDEAGPSTPPPPPAIPLPLLVTSGTTTPYDSFIANQSNIIIGTPGRLASFLLSPRGANVVKVGELDSLIMDEADRLLSSPDHRKDVERIMRHLPKLRRTHLFSATMTDAVEELVGLGLRNPVRIVVNLKDKRSGQEAVERRTPTG